MKKDFNYYMSLNYPVEISVIPEDEGGGYFACIPCSPVVGVMAEPLRKHTKISWM